MSVTTTTVKEYEYDTEAGEWPITHATVYDDQAEVTRTLTFIPTSAGPTFLKLKGLPIKMNTSSVRADVPSKNARLLEVFQDQTKEEKRPDQKLLEELKEIDYDITDANQEYSRILFKQGKYNEHQNSLLQALSSAEVKGGRSSSDPKLLEKITQALDYYEEMKVDVNNELKANAKRRSDLESKKADVNNKIAKETKNNTILFVQLLLDVPEASLKNGGSPIEVQIMYLVSGASWGASYDIRVEKSKADKAVLTYYGHVVNNTSENWVEVEMSLSTAKPSVGGALPALPRKQVDFKIIGHNYMDRWQQRGHAYADKKAESFRIPAPTSFLSDLRSRNNIPNFALESETREQPVETIASGDTGSTLFKLQRLANIDSTEKPHRQTITIIELAATFSHACTPKVSPDVYFKCATKNESPYPFLPGIIGVFIDGSFVSNSEMELIRANEDFSLFLGIDDSVRLKYSPEIVKKKGYGGGIMSARRWVKSVKRDISITNTSLNVVNCSVYEQLPLSKDGAIKIELVEPVTNTNAPNGAKYIVNSLNHLEATSKIEPGKTFSFTFLYTMEWPENDEVYIVEKTGKD